jgi:hypothetical protein
VIGTGMKGIEIQENAAVIAIKRVVWWMMIDR